MLRAMSSAVSGLRAHQNKLDVIGNNIANVNTYGYKSQSFSFKEAMYQTVNTSTGGILPGSAGSSSAGSGGAQSAAGGTNAAQYGYGTMMGSISTDMSSSIPNYVGGFNACINGEGFFVTSRGVKDAVDIAKLKEEDFDYTRVGQFSVDNNGYIVDSNGNFVYGFQPNDTVNPTTFGTTLSALRVPSDVTGSSFSGDALQISSISINSLGEIKGIIVSADENKGGKVVSLGKVAISNFQNPQGLTKKGENYFGASTGDNTGLVSAAVPGGSTASLMSGYIEGSNVDLAKEFTEMIVTQRGFQANSKIITVSDEILNDLVNMKR